MRVVSDSSGCLTDGQAINRFEVYINWQRVSGAASYRYTYWNDEGLYTAGTPLTYLTAESLTQQLTRLQGNHYFKIEAFDADNVIVGSSTTRLKTDTKLPSVLINIPSREAILIKTARFSIATIDQNGEYVEDELASAQVVLMNSNRERINIPLRAMGTGIYAGIYDTTKIANGQYALAVFFSDAAGNTSFYNQEFSAARASVVIRN